MKLKLSSIAAALLALCLLALCLPAPLLAEKHVEIHVKNNGHTSMTLWAYNGDDSTCTTAISTKHLEIGENQKIKCEGHGKHRCKLGIKYKTELGGYAEQRWCDQPAHDGETCTITFSRESSKFLLSCQ